MEDIEGMVFLILGLWLFVTTRRQQLFQKRLEAAKQKTAEKNRRVWEILHESSDDDSSLVNSRGAQRRRQRILSSWLSRRRTPRVWAFNRATEWWDVIVPGFTNAEWLHNFRMSEETFIHLCNKLCPVLERQDTNLRKSVPLKKRLAIGLWKLSSGSEYRGISHLFGVSITTVCRCVQDFCAAVETLLVPEQICFPDQQKFEEMAAYTENSWGLPQCIGAVSESHIHIMAPQGRQGHHSHRHSVVLQGVVDGKGLFWDVFAGLPGSLRDARLLRLSVLWESAGRGGHIPSHTRNIGGVDVGYYVLGDATYPSQNWLVTPFPDAGQLTAEQQIYNQKISSARGVVENAFSRLKGRWRCLLKRMDCDVRLVQSMLLTCCALHNLCERRGEAFDDEWEPPAAAAEPEVPLSRDGEEEGREVREGLMRFLNS